VLLLSFLTNFDLVRDSCQVWSNSSLFSQATLCTSPPVSVPGIGLRVSFFFLIVVVDVRVRSCQSSSLQPPSFLHVFFLRLQSVFWSSPRAAADSPTPDWSPRLGFGLAAEGAARFFFSSAASSVLLSTPSLPPIFLAEFSGLSPRRPVSSPAYESRRRPRAIFCSGTCLSPIPLCRANWSPFFFSSRKQGVRSFFVAAQRLSVSCLRSVLSLVCGVDFSALAQGLFAAFNVLPQLKVLLNRNGFLLHMDCCRCLSCYCYCS
jgi:hypothetical protein